MLGQPSQPDTPSRDAQAGASPDTARSRPSASSPVRGAFASQLWQKTSTSGAAASRQRASPYQSPLFTHSRDVGGGSSPDRDTSRNAAGSRDGGGTGSRDGGGTGRRYSDGKATGAGPSQPVAEAVESSSDNLHSNVPPMHVVPGSREQGALPKGRLGDKPWGRGFGKMVAPLRTRLRRLGGRRADAPAAAATAVSQQLEFKAQGGSWSSRHRVAAGVQGTGRQVSV